MNNVEIRVGNNTDLKENKICNFIDCAKVDCKTAVSLKFDCHRPLIGSQVSLQRLHTRKLPRHNIVLNICEVMVHAELSQGIHGAWSFVLQILIIFFQIQCSKHGSVSDPLECLHAYVCTQQNQVFTMYGGTQLCRTLVEISMGLDV